MGSGLWIVRRGEPGGTRRKGGCPTPVGHQGARCCMRSPNPPSGTPWAHLGALPCHPGPTSCSSERTRAPVAPTSCPRMLQMTTSVAFVTRYPPGP